MFDPHAPRQLRLEVCEIDLERRLLLREGERHRLSTREAELLHYFVARPGLAIPKVELEREVWEFAPGVQSKAVEVAIRRLRARIERDPKNPAHLHTVRNVGWSFTPLQAPTTPLTPRHNLPPRVDRFVGRGAAMEALRAALDGPERLICLLGPPGVGKTRLALEVLWAALLEDEAREVWRLAATDAPDLDLALADAMGLSDAARLGPALAGRGPVCVVLDEVEHLTPPQREALERWLSARNLTLLLVGRARPGLPGERLVRLEPMSPAEGAELLLLRARALRPQLQASEAELRALSELLDGLPLALELVAAQARASELDALRRRVEAGAAAGPLLAALGWSWAQLSEPAQAALRRCTRFAGGFDAEAAEAVLIDLTENPSALIGALLDRAMLRNIGGERLRFSLPNTLRAHVLREAGEAPEAAALHRAWALQLVAELLPALHQEGGPERLARLRLESANLERARQGASPDEDAQLALALATLAFREGQPARRRALLEGLDPEALSAPRALAVYAARAAARVSAGALAEAAEDLTRALSAPHPAFDLAQRASVRWSLVSGALAEAREKAERALADPTLSARVRVELLGDLAIVHAAERRWAKSRACSLEATTLAEMQGDALSLGALRLIRADTLNASGDAEGARQQLLLATDRDAQGANPVRQGLALTILGRVQGSLGAHEEAEASLTEAAQRLSALGCRVHAATALDNLADVLLDRGDIDGADAAGMRAALLLRACSEKRVAALVEGNAGLRAWARGEREIAAVRLRESLRQANRAGLARAARALSCSLAAVLAELGDADAAREALERGRPAKPDPTDDLIFEISAAHVQLALDEARGPAEALLARRDPAGPWRRLDVRALVRLLQRRLSGA